MPSSMAIPLLPSMEKYDSGLSKVCRFGMRLPSRMKTMILWLHSASAYSTRSMAIKGKVAALAGGVIDAKEDAAPAPQDKGAVHSADIEYAMGTLPTNRVFNWQPEDYMISDIFSQYYVNFVKTGNPNGLGLPEWPSTNGKAVAPVLQIDVKTEVKSDAQMEKRYDFIDKMFWEKK